MRRPPAATGSPIGPSPARAKAWRAHGRAPLLAVRGGGPERGPACMAFTAHGFVGVERETVLAMRGWVKTGAVPPDLGR